ncbi:MAG TPA: crosslink repair DNA glycosylase YcaQ family protein, partial [Solirubrobacteraceae bacterium]|nr:crosslink repair DNA glycosylase YcaQ family protein [Solirubrobacteraceae bacterium]
AGALDTRLPKGARSLRQAAWAGLQDSMPRAALLSIHARVEGAHPAIWSDKSLVQVWGPRFSVFVVAKQDHAVFTVGRYPDDARGQRVAEEMAAKLHDVLGGRTLPDRELGLTNGVRYATTTGTVQIRWEGARAPQVWTVPRPKIEPAAARDELARRYLHVYGPATPASFAKWAGIGARAARAAFDAIDLTPVRTPIGDAWILTSDEAAYREPHDPAPARLLPSGDSYFLLQGADRALLVPDAARRELLWTPRVWPGAVLLRGEIAGTWRRAHASLTVEPWRTLARTERGAIEAEAQSLPLPGLDGPVRVSYTEPYGSV